MTHNPSTERIDLNRGEVDVELPPVPGTIKVNNIAQPLHIFSRKMLRKIGAAWVAELVKRGAK